MATQGGGVGRGTIDNEGPAAAPPKPRDLRPGLPRRDDDDGHGPCTLRGVTADADAMIIMPRRRQGVIQARGAATDLTAATSSGERRLRPCR